MTDKELRRLSRAELLEMLIEQMKENQRLSEELDEVNRKLEKREIVMAESGSLAEAAMKLSGLFEAADEAALLYLKSIREAGGAQRLEGDDIS